MGNQQDSEPVNVARQAFGLAVGIASVVLVYPAIFVIAHYDLNQGEGTHCRGWGNPLLGGGLLAVAVAMFLVARHTLGWRLGATSVAVLSGILFAAGVTMLVTGLMVGCETYSIE